MGLEHHVPLYPDATPLPILVHVTAPASLPAGYTFEAELNGDKTRTFTVEVPEGGVKEGQMFLTPLPESMNGFRLAIPTGGWKDGFLGCFNAGFCHPSIWCAFCCPQILMAQVMTRMNLTWLGDPGPRVSTQNTFKVVFTIVMSYIVYSTALELASLEYTSVGVDLPTYLLVLKTIGSVTFTVYAFYSLCKTRQNVRARYSIPTAQCGGMEDCVCAFFCTCCTVSQLARHTGEYETYPGVCCSETGHPKGTPLTV